MKGGRNIMQPSYEEQKEKFSIIKKKPHHVPPHLHNAIELVYVIQGELELGMGYELIPHGKETLLLGSGSDSSSLPGAFKGRERGVPVYASLEIKWSVRSYFFRRNVRKTRWLPGRIAWGSKNALGCLIAIRRSAGLWGQAYLQIILYRCRKNFRFIKKKTVWGVMIWYMQPWSLSAIISSFPLWRTYDWEKWQRLWE